MGQEIVTQFNNEDPELIAIWLRKVLTQDPAVAAIVKDRCYDELGVPSSPIYPYIYWSGQQIETTQNASIITRQTWQFNVAGVWKSTLTGSSAQPTRKLTKAINGAICGELINNLVRDPADDSVLGWIWSSKKLRWFRPPVNDNVAQNVRILERGVTILLTTS